MPLHGTHAGRVPRSGTGCLNSPAPSWVSGTALVGMVGDELTLYDARVDVLGVLVRH